MKCNNCGNEIRDDLKFCPICGSPQAKQTEPADQQGDFFQKPNNNSLEDNSYQQTQAFDQQGGYYQQTEGAADPNGYYQQPEGAADPNGYYQQPGMYNQQVQPGQYGYTVPQQPKKKPVKLIIIIVAAVLVIAGGVVAIILGVKSCSYDRGNPQAAIQSLIKAINNNNSKEIYNSVKPSMMKEFKEYLNSNMGAYEAKKFFFTSGDEPEDETFEMCNACLKLLHKKVNCEIKYDVTSESTYGDTSTLRGRLTVGDNDVGILEIQMERENGSWYPVSGNSDEIDKEKLAKIFEKFTPQYLTERKKIQRL